jgi:hypothetical protein
VSCNELAEAQLTFDSPGAAAYLASWMKFCADDHVTSGAVHFTALIATAIVSRCFAMTKHEDMSGNA